MSIRTRTVAALLPIVLVVGMSTGCSGDPTAAGAPAAGSSGTADASLTAAQVLAGNRRTHVAAGDTAWQESGAVDVALTGTTATATGAGVAVRDGTVRITEAGTYRLHGRLTGGRVVVDAADALVRLVLDGVDITGAATAPLAVTDAGRAVVVLADGSENSLTDTRTHAQDVEDNAALYSSADLTVGGSGSLTVRGGGNDGIAGTDGVVIESGIIAVTAADDGIRGKDYLVVTGGTLDVRAEGDGLTADNDTDPDAGYVSLAGGRLRVTSEGDGVVAATDLVLTAGSVSVTSGGGCRQEPDGDSSTKGLKSGVITVLEGGRATVDASDDAVHSDVALHLNGSRLDLASGDDAVHAEGPVTIDQGQVEITSSVEGVEGARIAVNGGTVHVVASDDGINAAGGDDQATAAGDTPGTPAAGDASTDRDDGRGGTAWGGPGGGDQVGDQTVTVTGGTLVIDAEGDGFDSNGTAAVSGGTVVVNGPVRDMNGALDVNGSFSVSGGLLWAVGSSGMAAAPDVGSAQGWLSATLDRAVDSGAILHVVDPGGEVLASFRATKTLQNLVFSVAGITSGAEYRILSGGTVSGTITGGLAEDGDPDGAAEVATVVAGQAPTGGFGAGRGGGGPPGGAPPAGDAPATRAGGSAPADRG